MTRDDIERMLDRFFGDTSRPIHDTKDDLELLRDKIDMMIEALEDH